MENPDRVLIPTASQLSAMTLEHLGYLMRWHYDSQVRQDAAQHLGRRSGGRPRGSGLKLKPCPKCGQKFGVRQLKRHVPRCTPNTINPTDTPHAS